MQVSFELLTFLSFRTFLIVEWIPFIGMYYYLNLISYTLSEAWSGVNWADLMAAQGARTIVGTMLWTEYRPAIKIGPIGALAAMRSAQFTPLQASDRVYLSNILILLNRCLRVNIKGQAGVLEWLTGGGLDDGDDDRFENIQFPDQSVIIDGPSPNQFVIFS